VSISHSLSEIFNPTKFSSASAIVSAQCPKTLKAIAGLEREYKVTDIRVWLVPTRSDGGGFNQFPHQHELAARPIACAAPLRSVLCPRGSWGRLRARRGSGSTACRARP